MTAHRADQPSPPSYPLLHLNFLFAGMSTLLLGPTLPLYARRWGLHDSQSGVLIAAQFAGLFLGAIALFSSLRRSLLCGALVTALSFLGIALCLANPHGFVLAAMFLFTLGLGLGQITTATNLLSAVSASGARRRSAALSLLNFTWSAGAVLSPLVAGLYIAHASLLSLLLTFAIGAMALGLFAMRTLPPPRLRHSATVTLDDRGIRTAPLLHIFGLFLLYGGLEATVSAWLSTYTLRYTLIGVAAAAYCTSSLWISFAVGRALCALLVRHVPDRRICLGGLALATAASACLRGAHTSVEIAACAGVVGLGLGPFFPLTFSGLIAKRPSPRQAGAATSNVGLGSAIFPYVTGLLSTHFGSLKIAMATPMVIGLCLLSLVFVEGRRSEASAKDNSSGNRS
jgi:fucose permease